MKKKNSLLEYGLKLCGTYLELLHLCGIAYLHLKTLKILYKKVKLLFLNYFLTAFFTERTREVSFVFLTKLCLFLLSSSKLSLRDAGIGFILVIDRRQDKWTSVKASILRIAVSTFLN